MPRYKHHDYGQSKLIPVHFDRQVLPGSFEYTLSYLIEHECDLSWFEARYRNDETGAPAYDPAILLKVILLRAFERRDRLRPNLTRSGRPESTRRTNGKEDL